MTKASLTLLTALLSCRPALGGEAAGTFKTFKLRSGAYERSYGVYAPARLAPSQKLPLVVALHGGGGKAASMRRISRNGFETLADAHGALVAYPQGVDKHWNDTRGDLTRKAQRENIDDVAFLRAMVKEISGRYPVDPARVYATGISNGAMMSYALACGAADIFAAVAPVAGAMPEKLLAACDPSRPVPVLIISGTDDNLVHWEGGDVTGPFGKRKFGRVISVEKSRDFWLKNDACDLSKKTVSSRDEDAKDGTSLSREVYPSCAGGSAVELIRIEGGGHTWPGGRQYLGEWLVGKTSQELSACSEIWGFFLKHRLPRAEAGPG